MGLFTRVVGNVQGLGRLGEMLCHRTGHKDEKREENRENAKNGCNDYWSEQVVRTGVKYVMN
jgi:hypothetical protein